jgi:hypothetical protein
MSDALYALLDELARDRELMRARVSGEPDHGLRTLWAVSASHRRIERDILHSILRAREIDQHADRTAATCSICLHD